MINRFTKLCVALSAVILALGAQANSNNDGRGVVYTLSNAVAGNSVLTFARDAHGNLTPGPSFATGGTGTGGGLGNQGAVISHGKLLLAVNAGSDDISLFAVRPWGLKLLDTIPSGGVQPVSVTAHGRLVYVVNAGSDNIAGFWIGHDRLYALPGSEHGLSGAGTAPAQIQFTPNGRALVVTEKDTNNIVTFDLNWRGVPDARHITTSAAPTPFGFDITKSGTIVVSEAVGGAPNASALSSYRVNRSGDLNVLSAAIGTTQTAACWVVITADGRLAFTTNTGSGTVSTYRIRPNGQITLLAALGGITGEGSAPTDAALNKTGEFLHVLNSGANSISTFRVGSGGALHHVGDAVGVPAGATGLVAY